MVPRNSVHTRNFGHSEVFSRPRPFSFSRFYVQTFNAMTRAVSHERENLIFFCRPPRVKLLTLSLSLHRPLVHSPPRVFAAIIESLATITSFRYRPLLVVPNLFPPRLFRGVVHSVVRPGGVYTNLCASVHYAALRHVQLRFPVF